MKEVYPEIAGTIGIAHEIHTTSEEGLKNALAYFSTDYDITDCMEDKQYPHSGYWCKLKDSVFQRMTQCHYCQHLNSVLGCKVHGYTCENCNKVIYINYVQGGTIKFSFKKDDKNTHICLWIHSYENERIICYPKYCKDHNWYDLKPERFKAIMEQFKDSYEVVTINGKQLLSFYYPACGMDREDNKDNIQIYMVEHRPNNKTRRSHYSEVKVYKGEILETLPVKQTFEAKIKA